MADDDDVAVDDRLDTSTGSGREVLGDGQGAEALASVLGDGARDRVLARVLGARGEAQQLVLAYTVRGHELGDRHLALGDGAGLVEHDRGDLAGLFKDLGAFDQDAELGAAARADHERRRRREPERAGTCDDEDSDRGGERGRRRWRRRRAIRRA